MEFNDTGFFLAVMHQTGVSFLPIDLATGSRALAKEECIFTCGETGAVPVSGVWVRPRCFAMLTVHGKLTLWRPGARDAQEACLWCCAGLYLKPVCILAARDSAAIVVVTYSGEADKMITVSVVDSLGLEKAPRIAHFCAGPLECLSLGGCIDDHGRWLVLYAGKDYSVFDLQEMRESQKRRHSGDSLVYATFLPASVNGAGPVKRLMLASYSSLVEDSFETRRWVRRLPLFLTLLLLLLLLLLFGVLGVGIYSIAGVP